MRDLIGTWPRRILRSTLRITQSRLVIAPAVEDADDRHGLVEHCERNNDPPPETDCAQSSPDVVARAAAMWECGQLLAVSDDRLRVARRDFGRRRGGDIAVQLRELIFRLGREDDAGTHALPACSAASRARTLCAVMAREGSATTASYAAATSSRSQASI